jgi:pimeloyl-ACP methyl ester carboxylesterase
VPIELVAEHHGVALAGSLHLPAGGAAPRAAVLMVPGSGPSDRENDVYFPMIRPGLLARGIAAASFDKRGVGGSSGDPYDTDIEQQTADVHAQLATLRARPELDGMPIGLFGHSQGGWVVLEVAAEDHSVAFVVTNSGPAVSPARQTRYQVECGLRAGGASAEALAHALAEYDVAADLLRAGDIPAAEAKLPTIGVTDFDAADLELSRRIFDHDPVPALRRIVCPILAILGRDDRSVDAVESASIFEATRAGLPGGIEVAVLAGANHRLFVGDPPALHPDYEATLGDWIVGVAARR